MTIEMDAVQPIVLVGGQSTRFGRDKLREPLGDGWMIDRPIGTLRRVFGPIVAVVGRCHPDVAGRADRVIEDRYPGVGPIGGILSALEHHPAVFVSAGDMPSLTADAIHAILHAAREDPDAWAVLARSTRPEPCVGLYRASARPTLAERLAQGRASLHDALPPERVRWVTLDPARLANVNTPADLPR